jgi:hypothetical protein
MATNATALIIAAAMGALILTGILAVVVVRTRTRARDGKRTTITDEHALQLRRELLADEAAARAQDAMFEIENGLQHQARSYRSQAVTSGDQLNEYRVHRLAG